ncbi:two-component system sensor histidine kinase KdpD [Actinoalloteichus hoggarensis]|nr:two-component system sensor histidine kinase KdpD [Actinoalloteichus hoggarensis]
MTAGEPGQTRLVDIASNPPTDDRGRESRSYGDVGIAGPAAPGANLVAAGRSVSGRDAQQAGRRSGAPRRGELRVYLGAAAGVGKTYAMLGEAARRRERGADVVIGFVESHGRALTEARTEGIEQVPRRRITYQGCELTELDVDAVLARAPEIVLVDELAHTNVPGSRNARRWEDVEELLAAGIDVLTTVNIQHLESLNDVVETITKTRQRETVPDEVVRAAEQVELVDITPEALRRRMAHGNVYAADRVDAALANFFRPGNLGALRELALLWVADQVEVALRRYRADQHITETWETRERVVVSITGGQESETLIRRARRIANRAGAELLVVHALRGDGLSATKPGALARYRQLAVDLGATFHVVVGDDVASALLDFARGVDAMQLVLGSSRRSRAARLWDEGIGAALVRESGSIDVHIVTHPHAGEGGRGRMTPITGRRRALSWALAVLLPGLITCLGLLLRPAVDLSTDVVGFLLVIVIVALVGGLGPALCAAGVSGLLFTYFLTAPQFSLTVSPREQGITLVVMVAVAVMVALVVDRAARLAAQAGRSRAESVLLASYARTVLTHPEPAVRLLEEIRENFGMSSVAMLEHRGAEWVEVGSSGPESSRGVEAAHESGSGRVGRSDRSDGPPLGGLTSGDGRGDVGDEVTSEVVVTPEIRLVLRGRILPAEDQLVLEAAARQALVALRQQRMAAETSAAQRRADATGLRTALLSALGHDLRTPLTTVKTSLAGLRDPSLNLSDVDTAELLAVIDGATDRLAALVANLLDSSRLATGAVAPRIERIGYDEVVFAALAGMEERETVRVEIEESLPDVAADIGLLERAVANVIDNALRYGRGGRSPEVAVRASVYGDRAELWVVDTGPGVPGGSAEEVFAPFQRLGDRDSRPGLGLGLSVARGFLSAMGGTIRAEDTPGGGFTVVISLPMATERTDR